MSVSYNVTCVMMGMYGYARMMPRKSQIRGLCIKCVYVRGCVVFSALIFFMMMSSMKGFGI